MKTVLVNALNLNLGGGRSIRDCYLKLLDNDRLSERYIVLVAKGTKPCFSRNPMIEFVELPGLYSRTIMAPFVYRFALGRLVAKYGAEVVLNFCDVIMHISAKQIYLLDFPYVLDVHPKVWVGMALWDRIRIRAKIVLHEWYFRKPDVVVAQTDLSRETLIRKFRLKDVRIIGNAATLDAVSDVEMFDFGLPEKVRLICPSTYHPHKNLNILLDVGQAIKCNGLNYCVVTTVDPTGSGGRRFVESIRERGLEGVIANVGQVPLPRMKSLYEQCDGVLMPTLLESFSIVYVEAMHHRLPILTSDLWFARAVCGDAAKYFNPVDANDILRSIEEVFSDEAQKRTLIDAGIRRLKSLPTWPEIYDAYKKIVCELLYGRNGGD